MNDLILSSGVGELDRRDIPGYEGLYAVTRDGKVWSYARSWRTGADGKIARHHAAQWMAQMTATNGYLQINLGGARGRRSFHVHRLVALAWIPNPLDLPQVNHIDGVKTNNRAENLEWCTASENRYHAFRNGLIALSPAFYASIRRNQKAASLASRKLTQEQAEEIRRRHAAGELKSRLAEEFGIAFATLHMLLKGETYAHR